MTGPASELELSLAPEGLPAELLPLWSRAVAALTESELVAVVLRFGFRTGKPETFVAIGRELGVNRVRAQAIFTNALGRLGRLEGTRALARYLANLNAVLSDGAEREPVRSSPQQAARYEDPFAAQPFRAQPPLINASREELAAEPLVEDVRVFDRGAKPSEPSIAVAIAPNDDGPNDDGEALIEAEEPVSEKEALALVRAADRELARAIESCAGREDLVSALQRARNRIAAGMREIELASPKPVVPPSSHPQAEHAPTSAGERRGRPANVQENARRAAVLERVQAGALTNAEAAKELGLTYGAWAGWKANHQKRAGVIVPASSARVSAAPAPIPKGKRAPGRLVDAGTTPTSATSESDLAKLLAEQRELERFGIELRERVRAMIALVSRWLPD
ncbi:MAG: hypothetical protein IPN34_24295 [Planctomycetes bacterium]|nr:hypothetical protein [Planctomycetota bacterium]